MSKPTPEEILKLCILSASESVKYHEKLIEQWNDPKDIAQRAAVVILNIHELYGKMAFVVLKMLHNNCKHPKKMRDLCADGTVYCMDCNADLSEDEIFSGLASFSGVPGRLEAMGEIDGVKIYNDNNATTPEATIKGLEAVGNTDDKNIILIAGGDYKDVSPSLLIKTIPNYCKKVFLLKGTGSDLLKKEIEAEVVDTIEQAVKAGLAAGESGDILLFSPGFASFGMFKNEYERNDEFINCINQANKNIQ